MGQSLAALAQLVVYLALILRYYETDYMMAAVIAVVNTVLGWIIGWVLVVIFGMAAIF